MTGRLALPLSTLEVNEVRAFLYADRAAAEACAWYLAAPHRMAAAGAPIVITMIAVSVAGALLHVTYPETGEELALAAYERLIGQGVPRSALRARGEDHR